MAQLSLSAAANLGSQLTGLPVAFVQALIQEEGNFNTTHNNPFDVTSTWAGLWGTVGQVSANGTILKSGYLPGQDWGTQGNIAQFTDNEAGVRAWANGINKDVGYGTLRYAIENTGNDFTTLANSFPAGYSGNSTPSGLAIGTSWANNVISIANQLAGQGVSALGTMPSDTTQQASTGFATPANNILGIQPLGLPSIPNAPDILSAISQLPQTLSAPFVNIYNQLQAVGAFLAQPHFVERILLLLGGGALFLIGTILFALSFVKTNAVKVGV